MTADPKCPWLGNRLIPDDSKSLEEYLQLLRHVFAYDQIIDSLGGQDKIIEVGFGEGYGTNMLKPKCEEIIAVDVEQKVVDYARSRYGGENCTFQLYDGSKLPFPDDSFNVAVSCQVIEHVVDDENYVSEIRRVLRPGGQLFMTTPNRTSRIKPGQGLFNRFHIREYTADQLTDVLGRYFSEVDMRGVSATDEILQIEAERIKQGPLLSLVIKLGIRKLMPVSIDGFVARQYAKIKKPQIESNAVDDFKGKYSGDDFKLVKENIDPSLDLMAFCRC